MAVYYPPVRAGSPQMVHDASGVLYQPAAGRVVVADNSIEDELLGKFSAWTRNAAQANYYRDLILSDGGPDLVAFWRFEGTSDASGNGRAVTAAGTSIGVTAGALNTGTQSRSGDGTANTFINAVTGADVTLGDFTAEGWINSSRADASNNTLLAGYSLANARAFRLLPRRGNGGAGFYFGVNPGNTGAEVAYQPNIAADAMNVWVHWVAVRSGGSLILYRNGVLIGSTAVATTSVAVGRWYMANDTGAGGNPLLGMIDEVAIYGRALTAGEALDHYNAGVQGYL
jgi:hypothetical protein